MMLHTVSYRMLHLGPVGTVNTIQHAVTTKADTVMTCQLHGVGHTIQYHVKSCTCDAPSYSRTAAPIAWG